MSRLNWLVRVIRHRWQRIAAVLASLFLVAVLFGIRVWYFHSILPQPSLNYTAEYNQSFLSIPDDDLAWHRYRAILRNTVWPERPNLETAIAFVNEHPQVLAQVRPASEVSTLGYRLSDGNLEDIWGHHRASMPSDNPPLVYVMLLPLEELPRLAMYLHVEGTSVALGDWERVTNNIIAIVNIAEQLDDLPFAIADVRSLETYQMAVDLLFRVMMFPEAFSKDQLGRIESKLLAYRGGIIRPRIEGERQVFADLAQRVYVIDDKNDGYLHLRSLSRLTGSGEMSWSKYLSVPWANKASASFKEVMAEQARLMDLAESDFSLPAWQLATTTLHDELRQLSEDRRYSLLTRLFPDLAGAYVAAERASECKDVANIALAIRRFVIEHGNLPEDLDALVPKHLREVPKNRFDGQRYFSRLEDERLIVYSASFDGRDDQGETRFDLPNVFFDRVWSGLFGDREVLSNRDRIYDHWRRKIVDGVTIASQGDVVHYSEPSPSLSVQPRRTNSQQ